MSFLTQLEQDGYVIIKDIIPPDETNELKNRLWVEFIEKAWPKLKYNDQSTWKKHFPIHNGAGLFAGPVGQSQVMWDLRQNERIVKIFSQIWNLPKDELLVSFDSISLMCPPEIRPPPDYRMSPHVDQGLVKNAADPQFLGKSNLKSDPWTIQGQFLFEDSGDNDGGFYCIPKSHLQFEKVMNAINEAKEEDLPNFFFKYFKNLEHKHVTAPKGSLILWDSRTVHWNQFPTLPRPKPLVRMVGFISYGPEERLKYLKEAIKRGIAFGSGVSTSHSTITIDVKPSETPHVWVEYMNYLEDSSFQVPKPKLTPLGVSLVGL